MWAAIAEFWWIGPTMIGAGTLGWIGLRGQRSAKARRLAYDASRDALRTARLANAAVVSHSELDSNTVSTVGRLLLEQLSE